MYRSILSLIFICATHLLHAQIIVPKVFSNHMVLQRNSNIPVWGFAPQNTIIEVKLGSNTLTTTANASNTFNLKLPPMQAGGPYTLTICDKNNINNQIIFTDILIGDVWLASGQSNMEWQVQQAKDADIEIPKANYNNIRFFFVEHNKSLNPIPDVINGAWKICDSINVKTVSAIGYYFARQINTDIGIPVGIIQTTWGGTPVEAWTSREMLLSSQITRQRVLNHDTITNNHFVNDSTDLIKFWDIVYNIKNNTDKTVAMPNYNDSDWQIIDMPKTFANMQMPFYEGIVWLRKTIELPPNFNNNNITINLGHPEMNYSLYFNGKQICKTIWNANLTHNYNIPSELIKKNKNTIAVRMAFLWGGGGFNPPASQMYITNGITKINIDGPWKLKKDLEPQIPKINNYHYYPSFLFNAMVNPVCPYALTGFLWYQGEANDTAAYNYRQLFPMLVTDWRIRWQQGYLPFLYVQLPNYKKAQPQPSNSEWAEMREAQALALNLPNTGMACITDIGDPNNIHPINKQEVARRLALIAKKQVYNINCVAYGPIYSGFVIDNNKIHIHFKQTNPKLAIRDSQTLNGFAIAGNDQIFYWAKAVIIDNKITVSCDKVENPVAVRYNWADNPDGNLINTDGLPALPFRTDNWKGITQ